jgi:hypothetical protein
MAYVYIILFALLSTAEAVFPNYNQVPPLLPELLRQNHLELFFSGILLLLEFFKAA